MAYVIRGSAAYGAHQVGRKFSHLAQMAAASLPVPPFFCVTADCFAESIAPLRDEIVGELAKIDYNVSASVDARAAVVHKVIADSEPAPEVAASIMSAFDATFGRDSLVTVRSSIVGDQAEDITGATLSGMSDSFLYVRRDRVLTKVKFVWASAFNAKSLRYHHARGTNALDSPMAVGIQAMVRSERSFAVSTCDPDTDDGELVVTAGYGIGEGVVQEKVEVDHFFMHQRTGEIRRMIAPKTTALNADPARPEAGLLKLDVAVGDRDRPVLTGDELREIVKLGEYVAQLFRAPQHVEGTIDPLGLIWLVRTRPVTPDFTAAFWPASVALLTEQNSGVEGISGRKRTV